MYSTDTGNLCTFHVGKNQAELTRVNTGSSVRDYFNDKGQGNDDILFVTVIGGYLIRYPCNQLAD
jgi:hypothetical protein